MHPDDNGKLDMSKRAIYLVLDMINDLVHEDGPNGSRGYGPEVQRRNIVANTVSALSKARRAEDTMVGFVRVGFSPDYRECPPDSPIFSRARSAGIFQLGGWGTEVHPDLAASADEFDIVKHRVSPFYGTTLEPILRANNIKRLYLSGISTNAVVQAAVREGHDRDYECIVFEDCCCGMTPEEHDNAISGLQRFATITTSADVKISAT